MVKELDKEDQNKVTEVSKEEDPKDGAKQKKAEKEKERLIKRKKKAEKRSKERIIEVKAIEFDWIFNKKTAYEFMKKLSTTNDIELFSNNLIKAIIFFQWSYYFWHISVLVLIPNLLMVGLFNVYVTWINHEHRQHPNNEGWNGPTMGSRLPSWFSVLTL